MSERSGGCRTLVAANYSRPLVDLLNRGRVRVDRMKCPAWPDLVAEALSLGPVYVHFPLRVGADGTEVLDTETDAPADWELVERLLRDSDTPMVNLHLDPQKSDYPDDVRRHGEEDFQARVTERALAQVLSVTRRFGADRVTVENCLPAGGRALPPAYLPESVTRVIEEAGCGLLLDLSHARLSADHLSLEMTEYLATLPLRRTREIHVSGVRVFDDFWVDKLRRAGIDEVRIGNLRGRMVDHLAMTERDWAALRWVLAVDGRAHPWVTALEYGGIGGALWEALADEALIEQDVNRLQHECCSRSE